MCLDPYDKSGARVAKRSYHDWILPVKAVLGIFIFGCIFLFIGIVLLLVGGAKDPGGIGAAGTVLAGIGGCCLLIVIFLSIHAYCIWYVRDQETQTSETIPPAEMIEVEIPGYATIQKPSSLKRNGKPGNKKVTLSPDVQTSDKDFFSQSQPQPAVIHDASTLAPGYPRVITYIPPEQRQNAPEPLYSRPGSRQSDIPISEPYRTYPANIQKHPAQSPQYLPEAPQYPAQLPAHVRYGSLPPTHILNQTSPTSKYGSLPRDNSPKFPVEIKDFRTSTPVKSSMDEKPLYTPSPVPQSYSTSVQYTPRQQPTVYNQANTYKVQTYDIAQTKYVSDEDYDNTVESTPMLHTPSQQNQGTWRQLPVKHEESELPEPQPLQYPSAKRPMTFEQQSSSKMSIYDNMLAGLDELNTDL
ncbi:hypothetical protein SNE40_003048 [Patella caerulea]|uniref:Uncharacterized protein n=1 Tax=Patella caerulea TaxID=87958 RepID=A0AAN8Q0F8_PATCE